MPEWLISAVGLTVWVGGIACLICCRTTERKFVGVIMLFASLTFALFTL